ncbi:hypothetical protein M758_3G249800 [Ceratodon purpureus]|nr:hypothetical protein M758_3G249800 [Ceratodon purpureus]
MDNLMDVLAQAQKELMKHEDGEQHTLHTEANLETLSKNEVLDEKPETNYAFAGDKNLLEENGLRSRDTEIEENKVDRNFDRNDLIQDEPRRGKEVGASSRNEASEQVGGGIRETERGSSNEQVTDTGSGGEDDSDGDQEFSDAAEDEFEVEKEVDEDIDSAPELVRRAGDSKDGVGLTEEESEKSKGEEVIFLLDLLALSAVDIAFPMKKMLCSPRILKLGFAFKQDQIHLAASFSGPEACGCFDKVEPYIDISKLYKQLLHANSTTVKHKGRRFVLGGTYSLSGISKAVLGHHLRKDAQCSDWEQRPLTEDQIYYAASDTHCLLAIFDTLLADALALISPVPAPAPAPAQNDRGDKPGLTIQQRASSLRDSRGEGLKFLTGSNNMRGTTSGSYIFTPKMSTASQMVEAALRPSPVSSPHESVVATAEQECSGERFSKFVKKYSERLLVNEESRSRSHARRPRGRRAREALKNPDSNNEINLEWIGPAPWDVRIGGDGTPKFLCDVMVEGLARQLRCVGVDAASPPTKKSDPRQMVEQAMGEGRVLLTKDIKLLRRRLMPDNLAHFVKNLGKWEQLAEVMKVFQITVSESDLLSRCVKCNGEFTPRPLTSKEAKEQAPATQDVPKSVLETCDEYWQCSVCGHLFWQGFQFDRARQKFAAVCVKPNDDDLVPETIQPLDIACEFLEEPEKAFALGLPTV